jgi:Spy/CpxP family protein refolding chaperone
MRRMAILLLILIIDAVAVSAALAQNNGSQLPHSQQQLDLAAAKAQRKAIVSQNMYLTDTQAKQFWPLYNAYEKRMDKIEDRHIREIKNYVASYRNLTDADANEKLDEVLAIQQARLQTQEEFVPKFRTALPGVVVTRFFQIDNKMHAMVQCNIAQMVPLAQPPSSEDLTGSRN